MSRIGNKPVTVPAGVEVKFDNDIMTVKGPKGEMAQAFEPAYVSFKAEDGVVKLSRTNETKAARARHGLYRSLLANMVDGVSTGFSKSLEVRGVGYRVNLKGKDLEFSLGFSHKIDFPIPETLTITFDEKNNNLFTIAGTDKQLVGQVAANIRSLRPPEPYKGKGIRYADEYVALKAGKSAAK